MVVTSTGVTGAAGTSAFRDQHVLSIGQFGRADLETLFETADEIRTADEHGLLGTPLHGKVMVSAFFDTSTRTRLAHESAMVRLGGGVIGFADASVTRASGSVGESDLDVFRMLALYGDVIVTRHPVTGMPQRAARGMGSALVINAGDGVGEHPTQTLTDVYTLWRRFGRVDGLHIAVLNDLRMRCVRSLLRALRHFDVDVTGVPAAGKGFEPELVQECAESGPTLRGVAPMREALATVDAVYSSPTIIDDLPDQAPWRPDVAEDGDTPLTAQLLDEAAGPEMAVLHPLPRKGELDESVDDTTHNGYWQQARNGVLIRMALLKLMFEEV
jgi:aspartate carbamoyltransferase catalytic subunit